MEWLELEEYVLGMYGLRQGSKFTLPHWVEANFWLPKFIVIKKKNDEKLAMPIISINLQGSKFTLPHCLLLL